MDLDTQAIYDKVAAELMTSPTVRAGKMFGVPCLLNNGKVFAGYYKGTMIFKLKTLAHTEALSLDGAKLFDPSGRGRPMKEWVQVPAEHEDRWLEFGQEALLYSDAST